MTAGYLSRDRLDALASSLDQRDYSVIKELAALRFASASQLARLCFVDESTPNVRAARRALRRLGQEHVLARLPRQVGGRSGGSAGFVYHLGLAGQRLARQRGWLAERRTRRIIPGRLFVRHALAVAELHVQLTEGERAGHYELLERTAEPACWRRASGFILKPDSYVRLGIGDFEDSYFIEVDRATEGSRTIQRQIDRYLSYHQSGQEQAKRSVFPKVLWLTPDPDRLAVIASLIDQLLPPDRELFAATEFDGAVGAITAETGSIEQALESTM